MLLCVSFIFPPAQVVLPHTLTVTSHINNNIMGENAKTEWEWHNNEVGVGYAARGVVRQRVTGYETSKIIDMSKPAPTGEENIEDFVVKEKSNATKINERDRDHAVKKKRKKDTEISTKKEACHTFNPFLQIFASQISDTTRHFSVE